MKLTQQQIGTALLVIGILCGAVILIRAFLHKESFRKENGNLPLLCVLEVLIYFAASIGISDFLLNTLAVKALHLTDDEHLPGTLIACGLTPGAVIAFSLLRAENPVDSLTLILCCAGITIGCALGGFLVGKADGKKINRILRILLIASLAALILKIIVSAGASGTLTGLVGWKLIVAALFSVFWGAVNMVGVPMKPAGTAFFLIMGLSPLTTLTLVLVMGCMGPMVGGGYSVLKSGRYHARLAAPAVLFGSLGAVLGTLFTVSLPPVLLNIILIVVMIIAIVSMFKTTQDVCP